MNRRRIWAFLQTRVVGGRLVIVERMNYSPSLGVRVPEGRHRPQSPQIELVVTSCLCGEWCSLGNNFRANCNAGPLAAARTPALASSQNDNLSATLEVA